MATKHTWYFSGISSALGMMLGVKLPVNLSLFLIRLSDIVLIRLFFLAPISRDICAIVYRLVFTLRIFLPIYAPAPCVGQDLLFGCRKLNSSVHPRRHQQAR